MKKITYCAVALSLLTASSCMNGILETETPDYGKQVEFTASSDLTRTSLANDGLSLFWNPGDKISVYGMSKKGVEFTTDIKENSVTAIFKGMEEPFFGGKYFAVYPSSAVKNWVSPGRAKIEVPLKQKAVKGNIDNGLNITYANTVKEEMKLNFHNCLSFLRISVADANIHTIKVMSLDNTCQLVGQIDLDCITQEQQKLYPQKNYTTDYVVELDGVTGNGVYYIAVIPGTYTNGFNIIGMRTGKGPVVHNLGGERILEGGNIYNLGELK